MTIDGSSYAGAESATFTLFDVGNNFTVMDTSNITITGFDSYGGACVTQDADSGLITLTVIPEPATLGMLAAGAIILLICRMKT